MPDNDDDILTQFKEFMEAKAQSDRENSGADDEIEVWNSDGSGMRGKRSSLLPWLEKAGFAPAPEPPKTDDKTDDKKTGRQSKGPAAQNQQTSTATRYFKKPAS